MATPTAWRPTSQTAVVSMCVWGWCVGVVALVCRCVWECGVCVCTCACLHPPVLYAPSRAPLGPAVWRHDSPAGSSLLWRSQGLHGRHRRAPTLPYVYTYTTPHTIIPQAPHLATTLYHISDWPFALKYFFDINFIAKEANCLFYYYWINIPLYSQLMPR